MRKGNTIMAIIDHEGINNEAKLYEIASIIDNRFFMESIRDQIYSGLDCTSKDYLKEFNIKLKTIMDNYDPADYDEVTEFREELNKSIISWIEDKYSVEIEYDDDNLYQLVKQLYRFFVVDLKDSITAFLYYYIRENYETLLSNIGSDQLNRSSIKDGVDPELEKQLLLLSNLGTVIDTVIGLDIDFQTFVNYASRGGDIRSLNELNSAAEDGESLHVSSEDTVFSTLMQEMKDNVYDHNIVVQLNSMLMDSFNLNMTGDEI